MPRTAPRLLALALTALLTTALISGCCEDCDCPGEPDPEDELVGQWECVRAVVNEESQPASIGTIMTLDDDGTGTTGTPGDLDQQSFQWAANDSTVFLEMPDFGLSTGYYYTILDDTLFTWASGTFFGGTLLEMEADYIRWDE